MRFGSPLPFVGSLFFAAALSLAAQQPASGPTLEQTIAYINEGFNTLGAFDFVSKSDRSDTQLKWVGPCGDKQTTTKVESQHIEMVGPNSLVYAYKAKEQFDDTECVVVDKSGNTSPVKGGVISPTDFNKKGKKVTNTTEQRTDQILTILMDKTDPRKVHVVANTRSVWTMAERDDQPDSYKDEATLPATFTVFVGAPGGKEIPLGTFVDKDRADRVAKAYIHAFAMKFTGTGDLF